MTPTVDELLAGYSPAVRDLALKAHALVRDVMPAATEQVGAPAKLIAYALGDKMADTIAPIPDKPGAPQLE
jgi:hypothetical protein